MASDEGGEGMAEKDSPVLYRQEVSLPWSFVVFPVEEGTSQVFIILINCISRLRAARTLLERF